MAVSQKTRVWTLRRPPSSVVVVSFWDGVDPVAVGVAELVVVVVPAELSFAVESSLSSD
jgi:hypothetical protein